MTKKHHACTSQSAYSLQSHPQPAPFKGSQDLTISRHFHARASHVPYSSWSVFGSDLQTSCREPVLDLQTREFSVSRWRATVADLLLRQLLLGLAALTGDPWLRTLETSSSSFSSLGSEMPIEISSIVIISINPIINSHCCTLLNSLTAPIYSDRETTISYRSGAYLCKAGEDSPQGLTSASLQ